MLGVDFVGVESPNLPKQIQSATGGRSISLGLNTAGGSAAAIIAGAPTPGAHFVSYAWLSGLPRHLPQDDLIVKRLNVHGFWMYYEELLLKIRAALAEAPKVVASGRLSLPFTATGKPSESGAKVPLDFNDTQHRQKFASE